MPDTSDVRVWHITILSCTAIISRNRANADFASGSAINDLHRMTHFGSSAFRGSRLFKMLLTRSGMIDMSVETRRAVWQHENLCKRARKSATL